MRLIEESVALSRFSRLGNFLFLMGLFLNVVSTSLASDNVSFTTVSFEGSKNTVLFGINNSGRAVGTWLDSKWADHGLIYQNGNFSSVDAPGATNTSLKAINDLGQMIGYYSGSSGAGAFILANGVFSPFLGPVGVQPQEINNKAVNNLGQIVGYYSDAKFRSHGFVLDNGSFTTFDYPGVDGTFLLGINDAGHIVGYWYRNDGTTGAFLFSNGSYADINYPGASFTEPNAINNNDQIVGYYNDATGHSHGMFYNKGQFSTVDYPGAINTVATGINDSGQVVGYWQIPGFTGSFLFRARVVPAYHLVVSTQNPETGAWTELLTAGDPVSAVPSNFITGFSKPIKMMIRCDDDSGLRAPIGSCKFSVRLTQGLDKGGHAHTAGPARPLILQGKELGLQIQIGANSTLIPLSVDAFGSSLIYTPPEIGGDAIVIVTGSDFQGNPLGNSIPVTFHVASPDLDQILEDNHVFRLTGQTADHPDNHYLSFEGWRVTFLATDFVEEFDATLGLNDMSLPLGGLFDLGPRSRHEFWGTPHILHRLGRSVDIDRCALSTIPDNPNHQGTCPNGWITAPKLRIKKMCLDNGGRLAVEPKIHCEFEVR